MNVDSGRYANQNKNALRWQHTSLREAGGELKRGDGKCLPINKMSILPRGEASDYLFIFTIFTLKYCFLAPDDGRRMDATVRSPAGASRRCRRCRRLTNERSRSLAVRDTPPPPSPLQHIIVTIATVARSPDAQLRVLHLFVLFLGGTSESSRVDSHVTTTCTGTHSQAFQHRAEPLSLVTSLLT